MNHGIMMAKFGDIPITLRSANMTTWEVSEFDDFSEDFPAPCLLESPFLMVGSLLRSIFWRV